jgi:PAS domain S-box-containing protein
MNEADLQNALIESQHREKEITALLESSRVILKYHDFKSSAKALFSSCKEVTGATCGYVALLSEDGSENEVLFMDTGGRPCSADTVLPMPIQGLRGEVCRLVRTVYHNDFSCSNWSENMPKGHMKLDNVLFAPMVIEGKAIGLFGLANKPGGFTDNDVRLITAFADLGSVALVQKRSEDALRRSEEYFRELTESTVDIMAILNWDGKIRYVSHSVERILGHGTEELIGKTALDLVHTDDLQDVMTVFNQTVQSPDFPLVLAARCKHKDGSWRIMEVIGRNLIFNPAIDGIVVNSRDITERWQTEKNLSESESKYRSLFANMMDGFAYHKIEVDDGGKPVDYIFLEVNEAFETFTGLKREDITGKRVTEVIPGIEEGSVDWISIYGNVALSGEVKRFENYSEPLKKWYSVSAYSPEPGFFAVVFEDITARKAAEEILQKSRKELERQVEERTFALNRERNRLKGILDSLNDGVYIVDQANEILYINPVIERDFGPIQGRKCHEYFHDLPSTCSWCKNKEVFAGQSVTWEWYSAKTGKTYELFDTPITWDDSVAKLEIFHDITVRKAGENALIASEEKYRVLVETMNDGLGSIDRNGVWTYVNKRLCELLRYDSDELIGRPLSVFLDKPDKRIFEEQLELRRRGRHDPYELAFVRKDGQSIFTRVSPRAVFDENGDFKGGFAVITDISTLKKAEQTLRESEERLRHFSSQLMRAQETERRRISRELHDELGQSLSFLKIRLGFIQQSLPKGRSDLIEECRKGLDFLDEVVENVRRLSMDLSPAILEDIGLSATIRWMLKNLSKQFETVFRKNEVDIDRLFPASQCIIIYRILQESLTNIQKHAEAKKISIAVEPLNGAISFTVEDDGNGFDMNEFKSRDASRKGLGLSAIYERVNMLDGSLDIWSETGKGTRITFNIPVRKGDNDETVQRRPG